MQDMAHFMGQDAADFIFVEEVQDSRSSGNSCMRRAASRSKSIRHFCRDDVDLGHGQIRPLSQVGDDAIQVVVFVDFLGPISFQDHRITEPVGKEIHRRSNDEHDHDAAAAANEAANSHEDARQGRHEEYGFYTIHKINSYQEAKSQKVKFTIFPLYTVLCSLSI